jgi:signal transduction histidine kinase
MNEFIKDDCSFWAEHCFTNPNNGVHGFLQTLCGLANAPFAHIRILSRYRKFYSLVESIGPYKRIGWKRRFRLLDGKEIRSIEYKLLDYLESIDCKNLMAKYSENSSEHKYLHSVKYGMCVPLQCREIDYGYVMLSWNEKPSDVPKIVEILQNYLSEVDHLIPLLFSSCRSVLTTDYLDKLWDVSRKIVSETTAKKCYQNIANACLDFWGPDCTIYVGDVDYSENYINIDAIDGFRAGETLTEEEELRVPFSKGIFGFALNANEIVYSPSITNDDRFDYFSVRTDNGCPGSAICAKILLAPERLPFSIISIEHEKEDYFDDDDVRYLTGLVNIGAHTLRSIQDTSDQLIREIDILSVQIAHDVAEPLTALISDADVLANELMSLLNEKNLEAKRSFLGDLAERAANVVIGGMVLNKQVQMDLSNAIEVSSNKVIEGNIDLFRILSVLIENWQEKANSRGIELVPLFDAFKGMYIQCDETEFKSVIGHLLGNSIKYSFTGRRNVVENNDWGQGSSTETEYKYTRYVNIVGRIKHGKAIIEFHNYGVGILPDEIEKVKERNERGALAIKANIPGTGQGLWRVNQFFSKHGGTVSIESDHLGLDSSSKDGPYYTKVIVSMNHVPKRSKNG